MANAMLKTPCYYQPVGKQDLCADEVVTSHPISRHLDPPKGGVVVIVNVDTGEHKLSGDTVVVIGLVIEKVRRDVPSTTGVRSSKNVWLLTTLAICGAKDTHA